MRRTFRKAFDESEGVFYVICIKSECKVEAFRRDQYGDIGHVNAWEDYLAPLLAQIYVLNKESSSLLKLSYAGFPRGRVVKIGRSYVIYHGDNYKKLVTERDILDPFKITTAKFKFDEHERAIKEHRDVLRDLLGIEETWPAV